MSYPRVETVLPDSYIGDNRFIAATYTHHGDIVIQTGFTDDDTVSKNYGLHHGSETNVVAALLGYYKRLGIPPDETQADFEAAAASLLAEHNQHSYMPPSLASLAYLAAGESQPHEQITETNWECLMPAEPSHPGTTEHSPSTALYTFERITGELSLALVGLPPMHGRESVTLDEVQWTELGKTDVSPLVTMLSSLAIGEYRRDLATFLHYRFNPDLDEDFDDF